MIIASVMASILINIGTIALIPRDNGMKLRQQALEWSLITFDLSISLLVNLHQEAHFQPMIEFNWVSTIGWFEGSPILFAIGGILIFFIALSTLLASSCMLVSCNSIMFLVKRVSNGGHAICCSVNSFLLGCLLQQKLSGFEENSYFNVKKFPDYEFCIRFAEERRLTGHEALGKFLRTTIVVKNKH